MRILNSFLCTRSLILVKTFDRIAMHSMAPDPKFFSASNIWNLNFQRQIVAHPIEMCQLPAQKEKKSPKLSIYQIHRIHQIIFDSYAPISTLVFQFLFSIIFFLYTNNF